MKRAARTIFVLEAKNPRSKIWFVFEPFMSRIPAQRSARHHNMFAKARKTGLLFRVKKYKPSR